ncbi:MAG: hypothetical protein Q7S17_07700 [Xanthobacteraceae bacterium]|nr:hypothetical protein [Xanthobacteraceae bacterium]
MSGLESVGLYPHRDGSTANTPWMLNRAQLMAEQHGKHYAAAAAGRLYLATSASGGIALKVPATGGGHPTLWNPLGSGRIISIKSLELSWVSGNNAPGAVEWAITENAGAAAATGAAITAATLVAPVNATAGEGLGTRKGLWSPTTNTFTAAPVFYRPAGISLFTGVGTTAVAPFMLRVDYDGGMNIAESTALSLCFQTTTTTAVFQVGILYEEIDA